MHRQCFIVLSPLAEFSLTNTSDAAIDTARPRTRLAATARFATGLLFLFVRFLGLDVDL